MSIIARILQELTPRARYLIPAWFPGGYVSGGKEYLVRNPTRIDRNIGSFSININSGFGYDFASGKSYGLIDLYCISHNISKSDAIRNLAKILNIKNDTPEKVNEFNVGRMKHPKFGSPNVVYTYRDFNGKLIGYTCRFESRDAELTKKYILPFTYYFEKGKQIWSWSERGWCGQKPIYSAEKILKSKEKKILIVEGEGTCDSAQRLLPEFICLSWRGGVHTAKKVNWSALQERTVHIWPDNDACGIFAAEEIKACLNRATIVTPPSWKAKSWDLKNAEEEKISGKKIEEYINRF
jgi:hypothetical protein